MTTIHCIGDSHVCIFSGTNRIQPPWPEKSHDTIPFLKTYRLGAPLAYNFGQSNTSTKTWEKLQQILNAIPKKDIILFSFGEVDCRAHLIKYLHKDYSNNPIKSCAKQYCSQIKVLQQKGYQIVIYLVPPSSSKLNQHNCEYPFIGNCQERNTVSKEFNIYVKKFAQKYHLQTVSIFNELVDQKLYSKMFYFHDTIHLSTIVLPTLINKIRVLYPDIVTPLFSTTILKNLPYCVQKLLYLFIAYIDHIRIKFKRNTNKLIYSILELHQKIAG